MKSKFAPVITLVLVLTLVLTSTVEAKQRGGKDKVTICHIPGSNAAKAQTIRVSENALSAHLRHGDTRGACKTTSADDRDDRDDDRDDDDRDDDRDEEIEYTEVTGTVIRYDQQLGVILLSDGSLILLSEPLTIAIQIGMSLWVRGQEVDEGRILGDQISTQPFDADDEDDGDDDGQAEIPPLIIDLTGRVQAYDAATGVLTINAITAILLVRPTFAITPGMYVTVSGNLLPDGRLLVDVIEPASFTTPLPNPTSGPVTICHLPPGGAGSAYTVTVEASFVPAHLAHGDYLGACTTQTAPNAQLASASCPAGCDPMLLTLSDALGVPYNSLAVLRSQGYSTGVIARFYVIAQAAGVPVEEIIGRYNNGQDWARIQREYGLDGDSLLILGDGRGYSIRQDSGGWYETDRP